MASVGDRPKPKGEDPPQSTEVGHTGDDIDVPVYRREKSFAPSTSSAGKEGQSQGRHLQLASTSSGQDKEKKIGHRRVDEAGQVSYKKIHVNTLMQSIQLGIHQSIGAMSKYDERDLLMQDFMTVETVSFPKGGSGQTPAHSFADFTFRTFAPLAFRYFLKLFDLKREDFMVSLCNEPMRELSNPGASGSIFYLTSDDEFILKTVQHKEAEFLQKLLAGYYMNLNQNPHTLLPKFFGMYTYQCNQKNIRLTVMNNLLPSNVKMHLKFDLKGSTYKRKASKHERAKKSPTFKDLDFMEILPEGLLLESETYNALISTLRRDCRVLESFRIMDYSLLVGVHNLDQFAREEAESSGSASPVREVKHHHFQNNVVASNLVNFSKQTSSQNKQRLVAHSTAMESIQAQTEPIDEQEHLPPGGIPARNHKGERLLLFLGIIDILQSYRLRKKLEHTFKSIIHDGDTVSVHRPSFYAHRFLGFMADKVFKKIPSLDLPEFKGSHRKFRTIVSSLIALKHSPSRRSKRESVKKLSTQVSSGQQEFSGAESATRISESSSHGRSDSKATESNSPTKVDISAAAAKASEPSGGIVSPSTAADINLPAVLWDRPQAPAQKSKATKGLRSPTADACSAAIAAAFRGPHSVQQQQQQATSSSSSAGSSTRTIIQRGAELNYSMSTNMNVTTSEVNLSTNNLHNHSKPKHRFHDSLIKDGNSESEGRRSDSRLSGNDVTDNHGTPSKVSLGAHSVTWTEGTPSYTDSSTYSGCDNSNSRLGTGNTPNRSIGNSRESVLTRNYKDTPYHETEI